MKNTPKKNLNQGNNQVTAKYLHVPNSILKYNIHIMVKHFIQREIPKEQAFTVLDVKML
ncbi:MAG: hypothetical protein Q4C96_08895 [Planctomycetia bacterium]|nr:hypothetical protein [Planctomycetia bacterium]